MNVSKITQPIASYTNKAMDKIGNFAQDNKTLSKITNAFEPNGADNSFFGLGSIMIGAVLIPRILTALKRNPDNKEATKDEITEILFRDVQTILIMLFALKSLDSVIGNITTKMSGIPMIDKPLKPLFKEDVSGFSAKMQDVFEHPVEKLKIVGQNILDVLNPIGGSKALSGDTIVDTYSGYNSIDEIKKFFKRMPSQGGDQEKIFNKMKKAIIDQQEDVIKNTNKATSPSLTGGKRTAHARANIENAQKNIDFFKDYSYEKFMSEKPFTKEQEGPKTLILEFFKDPENAIAYSAKKVNGLLRTLALGIEVAYLGFGLPALNQKRLEKKYLGEKPIGTQQGDTFSPINDRHIKAQEIKLYSNFIK